MNIIVDTNIIFSCLLKKDHKFLNHILLSDNIFYSVNDIIIEIYKYKTKISNNSKLSEEEILSIMNKIFSRLILFNVDLISLPSRKKAYYLCKDIDLKDIPFVSLAIELNATLWTRHKKLINHLYLHGFKNIYQIIKE